MDESPSLGDNKDMKFLSRIILLIFVIVLSSCASLKKPPEMNESRLLLFVAEFHKPIVAPIASIQLEGMEDTLRFALKAPIASFTVPAAGSWIIKSFDVDNKVDTSSLSMFEFAAPGGSVSLLPLKAVVINKSRIEIQRLSSLDIAYVKGQLEKNRRYSDTPIIYPSISE